MGSWAIFGAELLSGSSPSLLHWTASTPGSAGHCPEDPGVLLLCLTAPLFLSFRTCRLAAKRGGFSTDHSLWFWPFLSAGFSEQLLESAQCNVLCGSSFLLLLSLLIWSFFFSKQNLIEKQNINDIKLRSRIQMLQAEVLVVFSPDQWSKGTWKLYEKQCLNQHPLSQHKVFLLLSSFPPPSFLFIFLYMCVLVSLLSPTLCDPMDYSPPGSSIHGIFQARILE